MGSYLTDADDLTKDYSKDNVPGRRLLIKLLEQRALSGHDKVFAELPLTDNPQDGFRSINYQTLLRAVDRCAHLLDENIGKAHQSQGTCESFLQPRKEAMPIIAALREKRSMKFLEMPDLDDLLAKTAKPVPVYRFTKSFEEARHNPCMVLHTSGSTGIPKIVVVKQGWFSVLDAYQTLTGLGAAPSQLSRFAGLRLFMPFPYFHSASIGLCLALPVFLDMTLICPPAKPLTADLADQYHCHANCDVSMLPMSVLQDLNSDRPAYQNLEKVKYLGYGGSKISSGLGKSLAEKAYLFSFIGLTEACTLPFQAIAQEDWQYLHFEPSTGCEFRQRSETEYEMVMVRRPKTEYLQAVFVTFPEASEWGTKDLYSKHPTKPHHWLYEGRADDVIIFSNGEKLNPLSSEQSIEAHPEIQNAIVIGTGRFQAGLLLDPIKETLDQDGQSHLLERVWPSIEEANRNTVAHGRINKNLILFAKSEKPLMRTAKGSVRKKLTLELYSEEIEDLYKGAEGDAKTSARSSLDLSRPDSVLSSLRNVVEEQTGWKPQAVDDLFKSGLDSLQTMNLTDQINSAPGMSSHIDPKEIYSHPTTESLANLICEKCGMASGAESAKSRPDQMEEVFQAYSADLPIITRHPSPSKAITVILTGSTGSLGSYLLDCLIMNNEVEQIYCLNRSEDAPKRQEDIHRERGLTINLRDKVTYLKSDFSAPYFGLSIHDYRKLLASATHVLHNAWPVNFNLALGSFSDTHVRGVRQFIDFSSRSSHAAQLYFLSTIGTVRQWSSKQEQIDTDPTTPEKVPEQIFESWDVSQQMGYAESKQISERLLNSAAQVCDQRTTVCRLGQVAGPVQRGEKGKWSLQEWFPSLVVSSAYLGLIPKSLGLMEMIDWVPVDILAETIVELCLSDDQSQSGQQGAQVHHIVNRRTTPWSSLLPVVLEEFSEGKRPKQVSLREWVDALKESASNGSDDAGKNPAVKLLPFFDGIANGYNEERAVTLDTEKTAEQSERLKSLTAVGEEWMALWMRQWGFGS
ncbi:MAG: hypothetical protein Q9195_006485 [Heterodermia aff. obscurata]